MGDYFSVTTLSLLLPGFFAGNTFTSDSFGSDMAQVHITRAESRVNGELSSVYQVPFSPVPPLIRTITQDISVYYIMKAMGGRQGQKNEYMDEYKLALEELKMIKEGEISLIDTAGSTLTKLSSSPIISSSQDHELILNLDDPTRWNTTQKERDDIEDTRD